MGSLLVVMEMQSETVAAQAWALADQECQRVIEITHEGDLSEKSAVLMFAPVLPGPKVDHRHHTRKLTYTFPHK